MENLSQGQKRKENDSMTNIKKPKGTLDIVPGESEIWLYVEEIIKNQAKLFGFGQVRFPTFEATELFSRGVGTTTDIVQKEMYTFIDKDGSSLTLRPEGTAPVVRSVIENGLYAGALPIKLYYLANFFRRERPQAGRSREFWQFGVEIFGCDTPDGDALVIMTADSVFKAFGLQNVVLMINSIGCPDCRPSYVEALVEYFNSQLEGLCDLCKTRINTNPLRILDCKNPECIKVAKKAPKTIDYLCGECSEHFDAVRSHLDTNSVKYTVNPGIVRGLDYYRSTVFEFVNESIGAQSTVCGGGRYDGLVEELGGPPLSGVGFGMGLTRLIQSLKDENLLPDTKNAPLIYFASLGDAGRQKSFWLANKLRNKGIYTESDLIGRSLKAQMKYADKIGALYVMVLGDNELSTNNATLQNMTTGEKTPMAIDPDEIYIAVTTKE